MFQSTREQRNDKMLDLLKTRADKHFEGFCRALEATDQAHVVEAYLQKHRVCVFIDNIDLMQSYGSVAQCLIGRHSARCT